MPPAPVVVSKIQTITQSSSKSFVGSLVPIRTSTVGSAVDGRVVKIFVDEGDPVRMEATEATEATETTQSTSPVEELGQPIVQLRTVALEIEIEAAKVELETRKMAESELQQSLPTEIESASAMIESARDTGRAAR